MHNAGWTGLIGAIGLIALMLLGLVFITRGLISNVVGAAGEKGSAPKRGLGSAAGGVLAVALLYRYFFTLASEGYLSPLASLPLAAAVLAAMAFMPLVETLVGVAALALFLTENVARFGVGVAGGFVALLFAYALLRRFFGR